MSLFNNDSNMAGIFRAYLTKPDSKNNKKRIYIPSIHTINPYEYEEGSQEWEDCLKLLPEVRWCFPEQDLVNEPIWVLFESGNIKYPVIIGFFKDLIKSEVIYTGGNSSDYSGDNGDFNNSGETPTGNVKIPDGITGWIYPLLSQHTCDPFTGGRQFGASRSNGNRKHAGIDLITPPGTVVVACTDGVVNAYSQNFYAGTDAVIVKNDDGTWLNYAEINVSKKSGKVNKGDILGTVIANNATGASMLHIEYYDGSASGNVLGHSNIYKRRSDLKDPSFIVSLPMASL